MIDRAANEGAFDPMGQYVLDQFTRGAGAQRQVDLRVRGGIVREQRCQMHGGRGFQRSHHKRTGRHAIIPRCFAGIAAAPAGSSGHRAAGAVPPRSAIRRAHGVRTARCPIRASSARIRPVTFDWTVFSSTAARFMLPRRATASNTFRSPASMSRPPSTADCEQPFRHRHGSAAKISTAPDLSRRPSRPF